MTSNGGSGGDYQAVEANENRRRRINQRAVLLSAVTIATIVGVVLVVSLTAGQEPDYKQLWCPEENATCIALLCPEGKELKKLNTWNETLLRAPCIPKKGWSCCDQGLEVCAENEIPGETSWCKETSDHESLKCCPVPKTRSGGIAPGVYKRYCSHGMVWVDWKKQCMRL